MTQQGLSNARYCSNRSISEISKTLFSGAFLLQHLHVEKSDEEWDAVGRASLQLRAANLQTDNPISRASHPGQTEGELPFRAPTLGSFLSETAHSVQHIIFIFVLNRPSTSHVCQNLRFGVGKSRIFIW